VHDIIPLLGGRGLIPGLNFPRRSWLFEFTSKFYKSAAHIIAISESTRDDLVAYCGCDKNKISVIYYGLSNKFRPYSVEEKSKFREELGLPTQGKLILITGHQYYKNHETALKVFNKLSETEPNLFLVKSGVLTSEWSAIRNSSRYSQNIIELMLTPEKMPRLYNAVDCLLFPSWYEGFGWPPLEAMGCGTPAVTSNVSSLPESAGPHGLKTYPADVDGFVLFIKKILNDSEFRKEYIKLGLEHAEKFKWQNNALETEALYLKVLKGLE